MNLDRFSLTSVLFRVWIGLTVVFLLAPLVVVVIGSLGSGDRSFVQVPPESLSLYWYTQIPYQYFVAFFNSIVVGFVAALLATILGVPAALSLVRGRYPGRQFVRSLFASPLQVPLVVVGVIFLQYYGFLTSMSGMVLIGTLPGLILAHTVVTFPYVVSTVGAVLERFDPGLEEAALILGASKVSTFRRVTLPIIAPGIFSGALYAFIMSFGNVPVSLFLVGTRMTTLPVEIFHALEFDFSPAILSLSTIVVIFSALFVQVVQKVSGLSLLPRGGGAG